MAGSPTFASFGACLQYLRRRARLTQRELAIATGYSPEHISRLEHDRRAPVPAVVEALFVPVLDLDDSPELQIQLVALAGAVRAPRRVGAALDDAPVQQVRVPAPLTPLIGREGERTDIEHLVAGDGRLVTLVGAGGSGKTRLAVDVGRALNARFADGVVWVSLAPLRDSTLVADAIMHACGLQQGAQTPREQLLAYVRDRELLLILDNFEHVLPAAPLLAELLVAGPNVRVLVTSRSLLNVRGEQAFPVAPLPLPALDPLPPLAALARQPAIALLLARAQQVQPALALSPTTAADLATICVRLDGLPLAIELAASRLRLWSPRELVARLDHRLPLLGAGARDLPERQRTMRAAIEWSYALLGRNAQHVLTRLAVFAGGWTLHAAETVCGAVGDAPVDVEEGLDELLGASLILRHADPAGETRLGMLELVREYAFERLQQRGYADEVVTAHAAYYVALAEQTAPLLLESEQAQYFKRLDADYANLLVTLQTLSSTGEVERGLRCATALGRFWYARGYGHQGRGWLDRLLAMTADETSGSRGLQDLRAHAYGVASRMAFGVGDFAAMVMYSEAELAMRRVLDEPLGLARALLTLSGDFGLIGDWEAGAAYAQEGAVLAHQLGDAALAALLARTQARRAVCERRPAEARAGFERCLALHRAHGDLVEPLIDLYDLAGECLKLGDTAAAERYAVEAHALALQMESRPGLALALSVMGDTARQRRDHAQAEQHFHAALRQYRVIGHRPLTAQMLLQLGELALERGDPVRAWEFFGTGCDQAIGNTSMLRALVRGFAVAAAQAGRAQQAARWWGAIGEGVSAGSETGWPLHAEQRMQQARAACGAAAFAAAVDVGRSLTLEQVIDEARAMATLLDERVTMTALTAPARGAVRQGHRTRDVRQPRSLTAREVDVLRLVADGYTDQEVAARLGVRPRTVTTYLTSIYAKLAVRTRTAAARVAREQHLIG